MKHVEHQLLVVIDVVELRLPHRATTAVLGYAMTVERPFLAPQAAPARGRQAPPSVGARQSHRRHLVTRWQHVSSAAADDPRRGFRSAAPAGGGSGAVEVQPAPPGRLAAGAYPGGLSALLVPGDGALARSPSGCVTAVAVRVVAHGPDRRDGKVRGPSRRAQAPRRTVSPRGVTGRHKEPAATVRGHQASSHTNFWMTWSKTSSDLDLPAACWPQRWP